MRITGQDVTANAQRSEQAGRSNAVSRAQSSDSVDSTIDVSTSDKVELSSQARDIQRAQGAAQDAPDIRPDRVEAARRALQNGTLNLSGADLADRLLRDASSS